MLPQTPEKRAKLVSYLSECVEYLVQKDTLDEDIKNLKDIAKEEFDMASKDFTSLLKVAYDKTKVETEIEDRQTAISNLDILHKQ